MTWLLDGNLLVAMALADHPLHQRVQRWRQSTAGDQIATCPLTEGTLLRIHMH